MIRLEILIKETLFPNVSPNCIVRCVHCFQRSEENETVSFSSVSSPFSRSGIMDLKLFRFLRTSPEMNVKSAYPITCMDTICIVILFVDTPTMLGTTVPIRQSKCEISLSPLMFAEKKTRKSSCVTAIGVSPRGVSCPWHVLSSGDAPVLSGGVPLYYDLTEVAPPPLGTDLTGVPPPPPTPERTWNQTWDQKLGYPPVDRQTGRRTPVNVYLPVVLCTWALKI